VGALRINVLNLSPSKLDLPYIVKSLETIHYIGCWRQFSQQSTFLLFRKKDNLCAAMSYLAGFQHGMTCSRALGSLLD
jgi:hypothetical protein